MAFAAERKLLITYAQLVELGAGRGAIEHAQKAGRLHPVHRAVFALVPPERLPPLGREMAAACACGDGTFVSCASAAAAWGIRPPAASPEVEVTVVGRDAGRSRRGIRVHRAQTLHPSERRELEGVPILAPERTLLDIAPALGERELERAFDEALIRGLMTRASMRELLERHAGRPGVAELRGLAGTERSLTATRSEAEERMLSLVRKARLPVPQVNVRVGRFTADFFWAQAGVIVEVDGFRYHRGRAAFERDHQRDAEHQAMGLLVIRVTWRQLAREPETVVAQIAAALARRTGAQ